HSAVLAGAVAGSESVIEEVRKLLHVWGQAIDPMAAWLIDRGMKTLAVRVARQNETALAVAEWCAKQSQFATVHYPGLPSHADHDVAKRLLGGFGGMLGVELKGGARAAERFLRAITIAAHAPSLGGVETLVSEPRLTSHAMLAPEARARAGIPDGFLRFSIGLEDADDIIADLAQALAQLRRRDVPMLRRRLGIVFQDFRLLEERTAEENVAFALEVTGARRASIPARVMRVLTQVGLAAKAQASPRELSGGEQQRVAIARALVNEPTVLLADEPTGNLDERATRGVFQLLRDINASGTAVLMATHDLDLVRQAPYRVIELQEGALVYDSVVDEPRDQAASP